MERFVLTSGQSPRNTALDCKQTLVAAPSASFRKQFPKLQCSPYRSWRGSIVGRDRRDLTRQPDLLLRRLRPLFEVDLPDRATPIDLARIDHEHFTALNFGDGFHISR